MTYKDWLETLLKILSTDTRRAILYGTNQKEQWIVEAREDSVYYLNKERQLVMLQGLILELLGLGVKSMGAYSLIRGAVGHPAVGVSDT